MLKLKILAIIQVFCMGFPYFVMLTTLNLQKNLGNFFEVKQVFLFLLIFLLLLYFFIVAFLYGILIIRQNKGKKFLWLCVFIIGYEINKIIPLYYNLLLFSSIGLLINSRKMKLYTIVISPIILSIDFTILTIAVLPKIIETISFITIGVGYYLIILANYFIILFSPFKDKKLKDEGGR